jgi:hypothetical protein
MMTIVFPIRLLPIEYERARELSLRSGMESLGEFIRLLLCREYNRRNGLPKPKPSDYQTSFRVGGRPYKVPCDNTEVKCGNRNCKICRNKLSPRVKPSARRVSVMRRKTKQKRTT